jgi:hypothetical protein
MRGDDKMLPTLVTDIEKTLPILEDWDGYYTYLVKCFMPDFIKAYGSSAAKKAREACDKQVYGHSCITE